MLPRIGITLDTGATVAARGRPALPLYLLKAAYAEAVRAAGGLPVLLAPGGDATEAEALFASVDGLVITGGAFDISPSAYGAKSVRPLTTKRTRTRFERRLCELARGQKKPLLGICGGMQILAVVLEGKLHQDIAAEIPGALAHEQSGDPRSPSHRIVIVPKTRLAVALATALPRVNSTHHQAVRAVPATLIVSAKSPDGVVEAIEARDTWFALGVQWHPELLGGAHLGVYRALVEASR